MDQEKDRGILETMGTERQRWIVGGILIGTGVIVLGYPLLAWTRVGFSFGSFVLYALFPALGVYFVGMAFHVAAGRKRPSAGRNR